MRHRSIFITIFIFAITSVAVGQWTPRPTPRPPIYPPGFPTPGPGPIKPTPTPIIQPTPTPIIQPTPTPTPVVPTPTPTPVAPTPTPPSGTGTQILLSSFEYSGWLTVKNAPIGTQIKIDVVSPDGTLNASTTTTTTTTPNWQIAVHFMQFPSKSVVNVYTNGTLGTSMTLPE